MDPGAPVVMIVDDEPALLRMTGSYLKRRGYPVVTFATTDEALDQIEAAPESISLAMLDLTMPGLDSRELARRLLVANPLARVIICSGYPAELSELEATGPGRVSFLHKPFSPDMLEELVRHMLPPADATTL